jgi:hypothetical protein
MKRRYRRNQGGRPWWHYALALGGGTAAGIAGAYYASRKVEAPPEILDVVDEIQIRLPQPSLKMVIPETLEEFKLIDEIVCEKAEPLVTHAPPGTTAHEVIEDLHKQIALELYPDFPWPPMSGDHPTISQLWTELGYVARRAIVTGEICEGAA